MKKFTEKHCNGSAGSLSAKMDKNGGNKSRFIITMKGGQFPYASLYSPDDSTGIFEIIGEFEKMEFLEFCHNIYLELYKDDHPWLSEQ